MSIFYYHLVLRHWQWLTVLRLFSISFGKKKTVRRLAVPNRIYVIWSKLFRADDSIVIWKSKLQIKMIVLKGTLHSTRQRYLRLVPNGSWSTRQTRQLLGANFDWFIIWFGGLFLVALACVARFWPKKIAANVLGRPKFSYSPGCLKGLLTSKNNLTNESEYCLWWPPAAASAAVRIQLSCWPPLRCSNWDSDLSGDLMVAIWRAYNH